MMPFAGFDMPVHYGSIIEEHKCVRTSAGLFDVSHMGEVMVEGPKAFAFIQHLVSNDISRLSDGRALYTVMCNPEGGVLDDLLVYRLGEEAYMLVINASNIADDFAWMEANNPMGARLENKSEEIGLLAIQGPTAFRVVQQLTDFPIEDLKYYHFKQMAPGSFLGCKQAILSYTGYTGEPGLEIYCEAEKTTLIWEALMVAGADEGLRPVGLGARDTLRLESGFCLYGHELTEHTTPLEAGLGWLTKLDKPEFIGHKALRQQKADGIPRKLIGFVLEGRGIPRQAYAILNASNESIGEVTSGTQSPLLNKGIGMGYVPNDPAYTLPGTLLTIDARGRLMNATVQKPPFHKQ